MTCQPGTAGKEPELLPNGVGPRNPRPGACPVLLRTMSDHVPVLPSLCRCVNPLSSSSPSSQAQGHGGKASPLGWPQASQVGRRDTGSGTELAQRGVRGSTWMAGAAFQPRSHVTRSQWAGVPHADSRAWGEAARRAVPSFLLPFPWQMPPPGV